MRTNHIGSGLYSIREKLFTWNPVTGSIKPVIDSFGFIPAAVNYKIFYCCTIKPFCCLFKIFKRRISPGCAIFIKNYRKVCVYLTYAWILCLYKLITNFFKAAALCNYSLWRFKCFSSFKNLCPGTKITVCNSSMNIYFIRITENFELPA